MVTDERLAEMALKASQNPHMQDETAAFRELQSLRSKPVVGVERLWDIEEFKVWKGLDLNKPQWASQGFACPSWEDANDLVKYLEHNDPTIILRVVTHERSALLRKATAPVVGEPMIWQARDQNGHWVNCVNKETAEHVAEMNGGVTVPSTPAHSHRLS